jgi:hypothetical protein
MVLPVPRNGDLKIRVGKNEIMHSAAYGCNPNFRFQISDSRSHRDNDSFDRKSLRAAEKFYDVSARDYA